MPTVIQSIQRCMTVLESLNLRNGATVTELCQETGLTSGTVYRILETLRRDGFIRKDPGSAHYWLTGRLRALCDGYQDEWWIDAFARDAIVSLGQSMRWPVKLLTRSAREMLVRVTTDFASPYTDGKYPSGLRIAMLWSAAGRSYLAFCDAEERRVLLQMLAGEETKQYSAKKKRHARPSTPIRSDGYPVVDTSRQGANTGIPLGLERELKKVRNSGYAIVYTSGTVFYTVAVPVMSGDVAIGAIAAHIFRAVLRPADAVAAHLHSMQAVAAEIGRRFRGF